MGASTGAVITGSQLLSQAAASAAPALSPHGSNGIEHVVILMMENRSFDHFLSWLPGADGRRDMAYLSTDGNVYPNYPLAPDFQGCGYSDPDHSWEGFLVQRNFGRMDGFLQRPTAPAGNPGVTLAAANTFPAGYYTNFHHDGRRKPVPDLPVIGALAENYTTLDRYFCSFAGETFPNRFYQHAARTDRDHNSNNISALATIWDKLSPIPNTQGVPTGEWGGFFDHVPPPRVIDDTDPATADHTGDGTTPTDGQLIPDYRQLGFRVPAIVVSNLAPATVVQHGPFEHASTLKRIESTFGFQPLTARDAHAEDLGDVLDRRPSHRFRRPEIPTSSQVLGPVSDAAAVCSADSVRSVSPEPLHRGHRQPGARVLPQSGSPTGAGMVGFGQEYRKEHGR